MTACKHEPYIITYTGLKFALRDKSTDFFKLEDIAHSLSMQCRYTGHIKQFYSVAEHCVLMSRYVKDPDCKVIALFHDAVEAYVGDLASPLKQYLPGYKKIEDEIEQRLFMWLGISIEAHVKRLVKILDMRMLLTERNALLQTNDREWLEDNFVSPLDIEIQCWDPKAAKQQFLDQVKTIGIQCK